MRKWTKNDQEATVVKGLRHIYIFHLEGMFRRFDYGFKHPYRSMAGSLLRGFVTLWAFLLSTGLLFGIIHITH